MIVFDVGDKCIAQGVRISKNAIKSGVFVNVVIKVSVNPWCLPSG